MLYIYIFHFMYTTHNLLRISYMILSKMCITVSATHSLLRIMQLILSKLWVPVVYFINVSTSIDESWLIRFQSACKVQSPFKLPVSYQPFLFDCPSEASERGTLTIHQMMRHLHINIMNKKSKNIDTLHLAAEVKNTACVLGGFSYAQNYFLDLKDFNV